MSRSYLKQSQIDKIMERAEADGHRAAKSDWSGWWVCEKCGSIVDEYHVHCNNSGAAGHDVCLECWDKMSAIQSKNCDPDYGRE